MTNTQLKKLITETQHYYLSIGLRVPSKLKRQWIARAGKNLCLHIDLKKMSEFIRLRTKGVSIMNAIEEVDNSEEARELAADLVYITSQVNTLAK